MAASQDAVAPPWGPEFLRLNSWPYRLEYAVATASILLLLFVWRLWILRSLSSVDLLLVLFWAAWPDVLAFVPIGLQARRSRTWPKWGPALYNAGHSLLVWAAVFGLWSVLERAVPWPLLAWAGHITADRAVGYHLRTPVRQAG